MGGVVHFVPGKAGWCGRGAGVPAPVRCPHRHCRWTPRRFFNYGIPVWWRPIGVRSVTPISSHSSPDPAISTMSQVQGIGIGILPPSASAERAPCALWRVSIFMKNPVGSTCRSRSCTVWKDSSVLSCLNWMFNSSLSCDMLLQLCLRGGTLSLP